MALHSDRIARQVRRCPNCGKYLTGLKGGGDGFYDFTNWYCEDGCDREFIQRRGVGMVDITDEEKDVVQMMSSTN